MKIGMNILRLRKERNMTQAELAEKSNVLSQTIYKYEKGIVTNIPSDVIERIASALNVSPAEIMGWETKKELSNEAVKFAEKYMNLSDANKIVANSTIDALLKAQEATEATPKLNGKMYEVMPDGNLKRLGR